MEPRHEVPKVEKSEIRRKECTITLWVFLSCFMIFILFMILMILGLSNSGPGYVASPAPKIGSEPRFLGAESILGEWD